jgi:transposase
LIRIDGVWLATEPLDMCAGIDLALARVLKVFGAAHPRTAYFIANRRANRMNVLVNDGISF